MSFAAFYLYLAWDLVQRLSATGELQNGWTFLALIAFVAAITLPVKRYGGYDDKPSWIDWPLALFAAAVSLYLIVFFDDIFIARVGSPIAQDYMMGVLAIIMVMEASRRTMGPLLPASACRACSTRCSAATCRACSRIAATASCAWSTTSTSAPKASTASPSAWSRPTSSTSCCSASSRR